MIFIKICLILFSITFFLSCDAVADDKISVDRVYEFISNNGYNSPVVATIETRNVQGIMQEMIDTHNMYRRKTGVPYLIWDADVAKTAQSWANRLKSQGCSMKHNRNNGYGENLAWASGQSLTAKQVVTMWYNEVKNYNYQNNSCNNVCGHYTQVVWKDSKKLGCGVAKCSNQEIWVCNYDPPGNYNNTRPY